MSRLVVWIHAPIAQALGWTLLHFLWEGAALAAILMAGLRLLRSAPAHRRYLLACLFLAALPLTFGATLAIVWSHLAAPISVVRYQLPDVVLPSIGNAAAPAPRSLAALLLDRLPWLVPFWLAGVAFCYARGFAGWLSVWRLRRRGVCAPAPEWQARVDALAHRLRVSRPVRLLESCLTDGPVLAGYLRPVILLPLGCLTGLTAAQVEYILLHELAHVARHDYLVNLAQSLVEGLLFYHPATWWISGVVRAERENCCDDLVVELAGDARSYAATLAILEERRAVAPSAALAANGGNLMKRIRRLTMERHPRTSPLPAALAGLLLVVFAAVLAAVPARLPLARAPRPAGVALAPRPQQPEQRLATPYQKWLDEEVVYIITDRERNAFVQLTTDEERENFIEQFWKRRDPTPQTVQNEFREEHYRRIAYANEHFTYQDVPGWKADRGRIYITYGPPDEMDNHSSDPTPTQLWRYRFIDGMGQNVAIEFSDPNRTGEFRMISDPHGHAAVAPARPKAIEAEAQFVVTDEERAAFLREEASAAQATVRQDAQDRLKMDYQEAMCRTLEERYTPSFPGVVACRDELKNLKAAYVQTAPGPAPVQQAGSQPKVFVHPPSVVALVDAESSARIGFLEAECLTANPELQACNTEQVTVVLQLGSSHEPTRILGEVRSETKRIIASFEDRQSRESPFVKVLMLKPGSYHLKVTVRNETTGVDRTSNVDFTVD